MIDHLGNVIFWHSHHPKCSLSEAIFVNFAVQVHPRSLARKMVFYKTNVSSHIIEAVTF